MSRTSRIAKYRIFDATAVATSANAVSEAIPISRASGNFSVTYMASAAAASAGDIDVNLDYEVSNDGTNYDTVTTDPTRAIVDALSNTTYRTTAFNLPLAKHVRIRATGGAGTNPTTCVVYGTLQFDED